MSIGVAVFFLLTGCLGGFLAGLLGVGGGILFVPCMHYGFAWWGLDSDLAFLMAVGTSLAIIVVTALSSAVGHARHGAFAGKEVAAMATLAVPMSLVGAVIGTFLGGYYLEKFFGLFLLYVAYRFLKPLAKAEGPSDRAIPYPQLAAVGGLSGLFSAILGVGGGIITVALLNRAMKVPIHRAIANSSGLIVFTTIPGTLGWIYAGWNLEGLPTFSFGYVNALAWALISVTGVALAQVGARVAARTRPEGLTKPFAAVLCLVGIKMLFF